MINRSGLFNMAAMLEVTVADLLVAPNKDFQAVVVNLVVVVTNKASHLLVKVEIVEAVLAFRLISDKVRTYNLPIYT